MPVAGVRLGEAGHVRANARALAVPTLSPPCTCTHAPVAPAGCAARSPLRCRSRRTSSSRGADRSWLQGEGGQSVGVWAGGMCRGDRLVQQGRVCVSEHLWAIGREAVVAPLLEPGGLHAPTLPHTPAQPPACTRALSLQAQGTRHKAQECLCAPTLVPPSLAPPCFVSFLPQPRCLILPDGPASLPSPSPLSPPLTDSRLRHLARAEHARAVDDHRLAAHVAAGGAEAAQGVGPWCGAGLSGTGRLGRQGCRKAGRSSASVSITACGGPCPARALPLPAVAPRAS